MELNSESPSLPLPDSLSFDEPALVDDRKSLHKKCNGVDIAEEGRKYRDKMAKAKADGNPLVHRKPRLSVSANWLGQLCDMTIAELQKIRHNKTASTAKRACALLILDSFLSTEGAQRLKALREMMDRTEGKAIERSVGVQLNIDGKRSPTEVLDELNRLANYGQPG